MGELKHSSLSRRIPISGTASRPRDAKGLIQSRGWLAVAFFLAIITAVGPCGFTPMTSASAEVTKSAPERIIIDTDLSLWWDDATAVGMANVLQQRGKVQILGVMSDVRNPIASAALDAIDTAYGHKGIPVGAVADSSADTAAHGYSDALAEELPHAIRNSSQAQPAVHLYRRLLAAQPDHSVTVVALGGDTNLAGLLRSGPGQGSSLPGRALVAKKVRQLVIEDGLFPTGGPPFTNEKIDIPSTRLLVSPGGWPTSIAWVDGLTGISTKVGGTLCSTVPPKNPMRIVYQKLFNCGPPGDGDWDGPTMLYAVGARIRDLLCAWSGWCCGDQRRGWIVLGVRVGHPQEVYVHVADQTELNAKINSLITSS